MMTSSVLYLDPQVFKVFFCYHFIYYLEFIDFIIFNFLIHSVVLFFQQSVSMRSHPEFCGRLGRDIAELLCSVVCSNYI